MKTFWRHRIFVLCLCWALLFSATLHAQGDDERTINLTKATLEEFIDMVGRETNTLFIYKKQNLKGELSITAPQDFKVKSKDLMVIFERLLNAQQLTLVRNEDSSIVEIVPARDARFSKLPMQFTDENTGTASTDYVMRIRPILHADMNKIRAAITPIFTKTGMLHTYDTLRMLIIMDTQKNVDRISEIIDTLDVDDPDYLRQVVTFYPMKHTSVTSTHKTLSSLYANLLRSGKKVAAKFLVETRQNALIIIANQEVTNEVKDFINLIDVPDENGVELTIQELNYAASKTLAPLLSQIFAQKRGPSITTVKTASKPQAPAAKGKAPARNSSTSPPSATPTPVKIIPFNNLNSLIIIADSGTTQEIIALVKQLDVKRADSGVELKIKEVKYASASQVANVLNQIFAQKNAPSFNIQPGGNEPPAAPAAPEAKKPAGGGEAKPAATVQPAAAAAAAAAKNTVATNNAVKIIAVDNLNYLIIIADARTLRDILFLVEQLDVERGDVQLDLYPLKFASAKVLAPLLANIFSDQIVAGKGKGTTASKSRIKIIAESRLNSLIIIADAFAKQRIVNLIRQLDVSEGDARLSVHKLQFASAKRVASLLSSVFTKTAAAGKDKTASAQDVLIIPDEYLNAVILFADQSQKRNIITLMEQLDRPAQAEEAESRFKLYKLQHAVAEDMATLLKEVTGNIVDVAKSEAALTTASDDTKPKGETEAAQSDSTTAPQISISPDVATNALLIFGPSEIFETLDRIIDQLDVPRTQVFIEAIVMEASLTKSLDLGIDWSAAGPTSNGDALVSGGFPNGTPLTTETAVAKAGAHTIGAVGGATLKFGEQTFLSFGAFVKATKNDSDINILANPQLLMLNNEEATINVSRVIPVATNSSVDASGRITDNIEFRDVGVITTIRPQVSGDDSIRLEIQQTSSDVAETAVGNSNAVTTFKRELKTTVVSADDTIVVLGGLLNEQVSRAETGIPGLSDIPLIGWLFGNSVENLSKTNLMIFIRPKIIRTQDDLVVVTNRANDRYKEINREDKSFREILDDIRTAKPLEK